MLRSSSDAARRSPSSVDPSGCRPAPSPTAAPLPLADDTADLAFSYITFQHCHHDDALVLTTEAVRVVRPGGHVVLNYRTWTASDVVLWPAGKIVRALWRVPKLGPAISKHRSIARLGWQANRLSPTEVMAVVESKVSDVQIFRSPKRRSFAIAGDDRRVVRRRAPQPLVARRHASADIPGRGC